MKSCFKCQIVIICIFLLFSICEAQIINVPGDYATIQGALNAAEEGYTVLVEPGVYKENIRWPNTNGIALIGSGQDKTIIDGDKKGSVITFYIWGQNGIDHTTKIQRLSIINGKSYYDGGGIDCYNVAPYFSDISIYNNYTNRSGAGVKLEESDPIFENVTICNNTALDTGRYRWGDLYISFKSCF